MSMEKITARILGEAREEAAALTAAAEKEVSNKLAEANAKALEIAQKASARAKEDAATLKERRKSVAELEARKMHLAAKQELIGKAFDQATEELANLPDEDILAFLKEQLAGYTKGEVLLSAKDQKRLGEKLSQALAGSGLTVSKETADIAGGFVLRDGSVSVNGSLESLLEAEKKQITAQIAGLLFS